MASNNNRKKLNDVLITTTGVASLPHLASPLLLTNPILILLLLHPTFIEYLTLELCDIEINSLLFYSWPHLFLSFGKLC